VLVTTQSLKYWLENSCTPGYRYKLDKSLPGKPDIIPFLLITFELNILFQNKKR
jgi:hypothetical protein